MVTGTDYWAKFFLLGVLLGIPSTLAVLLGLYWDFIFPVMFFSGLVYWDATADTCQTVKRIPSPVLLIIFIALFCCCGRIVSLSVVWFPLVLSVSQLFLPFVGFESVSFARSVYCSNFQNMCYDVAS